MNLALIVAAGKGTRMGNERGKQFLPLFGKPVLVHTLIAFQEAPSIDAVIIVAAEENLAQCRLATVEYGITKAIGIVAGGKERQNSVYNGLRAVKELGGIDIIAVHDGARALIQPSLIDAVMAGVEGSDGAIAGIPAKDTIKLVEDAYITQTLDRGKIWQVQTPQAFYFDTLRHAHEQAKTEGFYGTDDSVLVERIGGRIKVILGSEENIKITTPVDLIIAEAILKARVQGLG